MRVNEEEVLLLQVMKELYFLTTAKSRSLYGVVAFEGKPSAIFS